MKLKIYIHFCKSEDKEGCDWQLGITKCFFIFVSKEHIRHMTDIFLESHYRLKRS